jgi:hypothetical protein
MVVLTLKTATPLANSKLAAKIRSPATPAAANEQPAQQNGSASYTEGRRPSEAAIDPLSQVCTNGEARYTADTGS